MKKLMVASAVAMAMVAGSAMASDNQQDQIQFLGVVTETTCDITSNVDGAVNNVVQLGTVKKGENGELKNIVLKAKEGTNCSGLDTKKAIISFQGPLGDSGLENINGSAKNATVTLIAKNSSTPDQEVKKGHSNIEFPADLVNSDGYQFQAQLKSDAIGVTAGTFESALAYAVTYQ
ncbi:fimbrial protein [Escherichia coli]|nr:fimbrial protein [Escherichia coli]